MLTFLRSLGQVRPPCVAKGANLIRMSQKKGKIFHSQFPFLVAGQFLSSCQRSQKVSFLKNCWKRCTHSGQMFQAYLESKCYVLKCIQLSIFSFFSYFSQFTSMQSAVLFFHQKKNGYCLHWSAVEEITLPYSVLKI